MCNLIKRKIKEQREGPTSACVGPGLSVTSRNRVPACDDAGARFLPTRTENCAEPGGAEGGEGPLSPARRKQRRGVGGA